MWVLLAAEAVGGILVFFARLTWGSYPGVTLHVVAGLILTGAFVVYQWRHWLRIAPYRFRQDYVLGLIASIAMGATLLSGSWLGWEWWRQRDASPAASIRYSSPIVAIHDIGSMLVLAFVAAHIGAVLLRDRSERRRG